MRDELFFLIRGRLFNMVILSSKCYDNIHMMNMKKGHNSIRSKIRIVDVIKHNHDLTQKYVLFAYSFTSSDTTSVIFNYGKTKILEKIKKSPEFCAEI